MAGKVAKQTEAQKGKRKTKTVNQEVVQRKICVFPREVLQTETVIADKPKFFQTDIVCFWSKKVYCRNSAEVIVAMKLLQWKRSEGPNVCIERTTRRNVRTIRIRLEPKTEDRNQ